MPDLHQGLGVNFRLERGEFREDTPEPQCLLAQAGRIQSLPGGRRVAFVEDQIDYFGAPRTNGR